MNSDAGSPVPSRRAWILAGAAAAIVFLIFEGVSDFIAVPLREVSSVLAHALLSLLGLPVTRSGTILSTPRATFDVVPACSGSTTLQVMLFLAVLWGGVHPRLTPGRRLVAMAAAVPLAVAANGLRVSALVAIGHMIGGEPNDFVHVLTGLVAFSLAMLGCFALTRKLASDSPRKGVSDRTLGVVLGLLLGLVSLPFLTWCLENWTGGVMDRFGFAYFLLAAGLAVWKWRRAPADRTRETPGTIGFGLSLLALAVATLIDINILKGFALLAGFLSLGLAVKGTRFAVAMAPVAVLAYLGFPSVSYQIAMLTAWKVNSLPGYLAVKSIATVGLLVLMNTSLFRAAPSGEPSPAPRLLPVLVFMAAAVAAFQMYYALAIAGPGLQDSRLVMSYLQGPWVGTDTTPPASEADYFGRGRIWSRRFSRGEDVVDVLVTSTGGDRHRAHPPEYCVTGSGWKTAATESAERRLGHGGAVPMTLLRLDQDGKEMRFCYWFSDGAESHPTFAGMLFRDTLRRLGGRRADWFVVRVMTTSRGEVLDEFLKNFQIALNPPAPPHPER